MNSARFVFRPTIHPTMFTFKQFTIHDEHCAMKVGTDGVLLGAWTSTPRPHSHTIDIGCGSGLISLMLAQREPTSYITGVEIDSAAAADAAANVTASPFARRVDIVEADILHFAQTHPHEFDAVVSNPPYHEETLLPPSSARAAARHTSGGGLTFPALLEASSLLLKTNLDSSPCLSVILPTQNTTRFKTLAAIYGFQPTRITEVVTRPKKPCKRTLIEFSRSNSPTSCTSSRLVLMNADASRTTEYAALCTEFYL